MGEVYKARDTRLDRIVALKVLPADFSDDPELEKRFEREARAISALSHPNICTLYDVGQQDGQHFLVMEYLDGETLASRLDRGALAFDEIVRIGVEICDALEKAHRQGIVHRDLKPGNIVLVREHPKLLDFGLAKWMPKDERSVLGYSEDETAPLTKQGMLLGTIPYMAPEQLEGREVDARSDIFALGAILYEMAAGVRPFYAGSTASLIASIMREDPAPLSRFRQSTPRGLEPIIRTCLAKNPDERYQSAHDVRLALQMLHETGGAAAERRTAWILPVLLTIVAIAALMATAARFLLPRNEPASGYRFDIHPPPGASFPSLGEGGGIALSPDGRQLVFEAATADGGSYLWLRAMNADAAKLLEGTQGGEYPFWSPDGKAIAFFADGKLKRMSVPDGPAQVICDAPSPRGGTWGKSGVIVFAPFIHGPLHRVAAAGGVSQPLGLPTTEAYSQRWPLFLDEERFVFVAQSKTPERHGLFTGTLKSRETRRILPYALSVAFAAPDRLYYVRDDVLLRQRIDAESGELLGEGVTVSNQMVYYADRAYAPVTAAADGTVVFRRNGASNMRIHWYGRDGLRQATLGGAGEYEGVSISPDGSRVAFGYFDGKESFNHIAIASVTGGEPRRFTFARGNQYSPVWSPDGAILAFSDDQAGVDTLAVRPLSATGRERRLIPPPQSSTYAQSWSPDGKYILFRTQDRKTSFDLHKIELATGKVSVYINGAADQSQAQFSPDGKWVAYASSESGRLEVYVQPFPAAGAKWQVSTAGGEQPRWRRDGKELFYLAPDRTLMALRITVPGVFDTEAPQPLFQIPYVSVGDINVSQTYDVTADGSRFLFASADPGSPQSPLTVVTR